MDIVMEKLMVLLLMVLVIIPLVGQDDPNIGNILSSTGTLSNACAGTYFVELNDIGNSCVDTFPVLITEPAALDIIVDNVTDVSCSGLR